MNIDVAIGDREVVDHRRAGHLDDLALHQRAGGVEAVVRQKRRQEPVAEEVQLAGARAGLRMRGHSWWSAGRRSRRAPTVSSSRVSSVGNELSTSAKILSGVRDDVGVG